MKLIDSARWFCFLMFMHSLILYSGGGELARTVLMLFAFAALFFNSSINRLIRELCNDKTWHVNVGVVVAVLLLVKLSTWFVSVRVSAYVSGVVFFVLLLWMLLSRDAEVYLDEED